MEKRVDAGGCLFKDKSMKNNISNNTEMDKEKSEDDLFVYLKSVEATEKRLDSIGRGIENERNKAGILLGFFFLIIIEGFEYFKELPVFLIGASFVLVVLILILLMQSFSSIKMKDGIKTDNNFDRKWDGKKLVFLRFYNNALLENIEEQKKHLTKNSERIKMAMFFLSIIIILLFINTNTPMTKKIFSNEENTIEDPKISSEDIKLDKTKLSDNPNEEPNPMEPDKRELSEDPDDLNPMEPDKREKSK